MVDVGVSLRNVRDKKGKELFVVSGGRFPTLTFKSKSRALEVAAQRQKYLGFMLNKDRNKLYLQK